MEDDTSKFCIAFAVFHLRYIKRLRRVAEDVIISCSIPQWQPSNGIRLLIFTSALVVEMHKSETTKVTINLFNKACLWHTQATNVETVPTAPDDRHKSWNLKLCKKTLCAMLVLKQFHFLVN